MYGVRCVVCGVLCGVRCLVCGVWCAVFACAVCGVRCVVFCVCSFALAAASFKTRTQYQGVLGKTTFRGHSSQTRVKFGEILGKLGKHQGKFGDKSGKFRSNREISATPPAVRPAYDPSQLSPHDRPPSSAVPAVARHRHGDGVGRAPQLCRGGQARAADGGDFTRGLTKRGPALGDTESQRPGADTRRPQGNKAQHKGSCPPHAAQERRALGQGGHLVLRPNK